MSETTLLRATLDTLLTPLDDETADAWRDRVSAALNRWIGSDCTFFRVSDGSPTRMDPLDGMVSIRDAYRAGGFRFDDPWAVRQVKGTGILAATFEDLLGEGWEASSRYFRELLVPHRIHDYLGVQVGTPDGGFVTLSTFNVGRPRGRSYLDDASRRIRAILPALKVGVATWHDVRPTLGHFGAMVDEVPRAALLLGSDGRVLHANSALTRLLDAEPDRRRFRAELEAVGRGIAAARNSDVLSLHSRAREYRLRTAAAEYVITPALANEMLRGDPRGGVVLAVQREGGGAPPPRPHPRTRPA